MTKNLPSAEQFEKALNEMSKEKRDEIINTMFRESEEAENDSDFDMWLDANHSAQVGALWGMSIGVVLLLIFIVYLSVGIY